MKIIGCLLVVGILLSYAPVFHMDECPEETHLGNVMKMDCGSPFHCPMIVDIVISELSSLPPSGLLMSTGPLLLTDGLTIPIFHPPKYPNANIIPQG